MTLTEARSRGAKRYQGSPCPWGHTGERYTSSQNCCACTGAKANKKATEKSHHRARALKPSPYHQKPAEKPKAAMPEPHVIQSDFIKPPTKAQLMSRR